MNLTHKYVSRCNRKSLGMVWIILFLLLNEVKLIYTDNSITITSSTCGDHYDTDFYKSSVVEYDGSNLLYDNSCSVEFTKSSSDQYLCVKGEEITLDCGTYLEYHEAFVKNYIQPERKFSCRNASRDEWCPSQYQDTIYIVIRKSADETYDDIKLRVYLKDVPESFFDQSFTTRIVLYSVLPIAIIVIISVISICVRMRVAHASRRNPQASYQTASGTVNTQTGYGSPYPTMAGYQPPPTSGPEQQGGQQQTTGFQGNYNVHPVQTAYPVQQGPTPAQNTTTGVSSYGQQYPNVPPSNTAAAPPSYESVVGVKH